MSTGHSLARSTSYPLGPRVPFDTGSISLSSDDHLGSYTWTIKKFSGIKERKILSEEFEIGTYKWRLLIFPKGNDNREKNKNMAAAVYLCFSHAPVTPEFLNPKVKFEITAVNQKYPEKSITLGAQHTFSKRSPDWGFTHILLKEELQDVEYGFIVKDALVFTADLRVIPRYMARNETGFVGLTSREEAQGLNPILQSLFHIPYFRKAIYNVNSAETIATGTRLPHALRRLFFKLQYQNSTVSTKEVVQMMDHCENKRAFSNTLEKLMLELMGSNVASVIPNLFEGRSYTYVEIPGEEESKTISESYKQIDLDIEDCKDVYDALENRCRVVRGESKTNEHRYKLFDTLPSILYFQLRGADEESYETEDEEAVPSRFKISEDLNMDYGGKRFFAPCATCNNIKNTYKLHSVFASHPSDGALVYVKRQDTWFKFSDEEVQQTDQDEVLHSHQRDVQHVVTALLYIRSSDRAQIMWETGKDDINHSIRRNLEDCLMEKEKDLYEKQTANTHVVINVATEKDFQKKCNTRKTTDIVDLDSVKKLRLNREAKFEEFRSMIAVEFKVPPSSQRYWLWRRNEIDSLVLDKIFPSLAQENKKLISLHPVRDPVRSGDKKSNALMVINVFLELPSPASSLLHEIQPGEILIFLKFYDPLKVELEYIGCLYVSRKAYFGNILEKAKALANVHKDLEVTACKLVATEPAIVTCDLFAQSTPYQNGLISGDVVIVQPKMVPLVQFFKQSHKRGAFEDDSTLGKM